MGTKEWKGVRAIKKKETVGNKRLTRWCVQGREHRREGLENNAWGSANTKAWTHQKTIK